MLIDNKIFKHFRNLHLVEKLFIRGFLILILLIITVTGKREGRFYVLHAAIRLFLLNDHHIRHSTINHRCLKHLNHQRTVQNARLASRFLAKRHILTSCFFNHQPLATNKPRLTFRTIRGPNRHSRVVTSFRVPSKVQQRRMEKTHRLKYACKMLLLSVSNPQQETRFSLQFTLHFNL